MVDSRGRGPDAKDWIKRHYIPTVTPLPQLLRSLKLLESKNFSVRMHSQKVALRCEGSLAPKETLPDMTYYTSAYAQLAIAAAPAYGRSLTSSDHRRGAAVISGSCQ